MPKQTYFRLPEEKQKRLLDSARIEFSRVPLQEASIANIVKLAEIPRGSFYQYFEDKEDLYYFYFQQLRHNNHRDFQQLLQVEKGDLFAAFEQYFDKMIEDVLTGPDASFYKNLFMFMDYHGTDKVTPSMMREKHKSRFGHHEKHKADFLGGIDRSKLKIAEGDEEELHSLIKLLMSFIFSAINHAYRRRSESGKVDLEETKKNFSRKLNWLKYGVYQEEKVETTDD